MLETLHVTHRREPLQREPTHMAKIDKMLSQIAKGRARNLTTLRGCFVRTKSDGKVVEGDAAASGKRQVEQVTQTCAKPLRYPYGQACEPAEGAYRQDVEDMVSERLHETRVPAVGAKTADHWWQTSHQCVRYREVPMRARKEPDVQHLFQS